MNDSRCWVSNFGNLDGKWFCPYWGLTGSVAGWRDKREAFAFLLHC